ncbi:MAG: hypothetical protein JWN96_2463 [Mycobacterium sp.]|jgi:hypothetical protein|nr:hypothetical protein [Mycobacterium sp.]
MAPPLNQTDRAARGDGEQQGAELYPIADRDLLGVTNEAWFPRT